MLCVLIAVTTILQPEHHSQPRSLVGSHYAFINRKQSQLDNLHTSIVIVKGYSVPGGVTDHYLSVTKLLSQEIHVRLIFSCDPILRCLPVMRQPLHSRMSSVGLILFHMMLTR